MMIDIIVKAVINNMQTIATTNDNFSVIESGLYFMLPRVISSTTGEVKKMIPAIENYMIAS